MDPVSSSLRTTTTRATTTPPKPHQKQRYVYYRLYHFLRRILLRPSLYVGLFTLLVYWDDQALHGAFVYDDAGTIKQNPVVTGKLAWTQVFFRDFWGTPLPEIQSHKSFRPLTTLTFVLNWRYAVRQLQHQQPNLDTSNLIVVLQNMNMFGFHIVNLLLHCLVTILVTEVTWYVFHGRCCSTTNPRRTISTITTTTTAQIITGCLFGCHPVHVEAVTNITSRGELLMSLFYLAAVWSYVETLRQWRPPASTMSSTMKHVWGIYIVPWICMICSMFSKEQGATTLFTCIVYDFLSSPHHSNSLYHFIVYDVLRYRKSGDRDHRIAPPPPPVVLPQSEDWNPHALLAPDDATRSSSSLTNIAAVNVVAAPPPNDEQVLHFQRSMTLSFLRRAMILLLQTALVVYWRKWLNGVTRPDFIYDQNPAGFAAERTTRLFSIPYIYCLYIYDYIYPLYLGPDWSGASIDLITTFYDSRMLGVVGLWTFTAVCGYRLLWDPTSSSSSSSSSSTAIITTTATEMYHHTRRILLISFLAFVFCPFLLSSNLLVVVGLMKADRVMYLPLMGLALLETLFIIRVFYRDEFITPSSSSSSIPQKEDSVSSTRRRATAKTLIWKLLGNVLVLVQVTFLAAKLHERNVAWSHSLNLWTAAYNLNPRSKHTMYNCGYELSLQQRYVESEYVLRPIGNPHVDGPSNTFIYAMVLYNLQRCDEANELIAMALEVVEEKRRMGGPRNSASSLIRTKSNLLVAQGFCAMDQNMQYAGQIFYNAVQADPTNDYAVDQANKMVQRLEQLQLLGHQQQQQHQKPRMGV